MSQLGQFTVEVIAEGIDKLVEALGDVNWNLENIESVQGDVFKALTANAKRSGDEVQKLATRADGLTRVFQGLERTAVGVSRSAGMVQMAVGGLSGSILGWVRSGLQGTVEGARLEWQMRQLALQIGSVALPAVEKLTEGVSKLVGWFKNLTGEQQQTLAKIGMTVVGVNLLAAALRQIGPLLGGIAIAGKAAFGFAKAHPALAAGAFGVGAVGGLAAERIATAQRRGPDLEAAKKPKARFTDDEIEGFADFANTDRFRRMTKEQKIAFLTKQAEIDKFNMQAIEKNIEVGDNDKAWNPFAAWGDRDAARKRRVGELALTRNKLDMHLLGIKQLKDAGVLDLDLLKQGKTRRDLHMQTGGFEGIQSTYGRIQEAIANKFDPMQAHREDQKLQAEIKKELEGLRRDIRVRPAGAGP